MNIFIIYKPGLQTVYSFWKIINLLATVNIVTHISKAHGKFKCKAYRLLAYCLQARQVHISAA